MKCFPHFLFILFFLPGLLIAERNGPYRVGAVLAMTGPISIVGMPMKNAMVLAKERYDKDNKIEIIFEDDGFLPRNTVSAAKKLIEQDKVDALIVFGTNQGLAIVDFVERAQVPFISLNVNRSVVDGRKNAVIFMPTVEALTAVNIEQIRYRGYKTIVTVASMQDSCLLQKDIIEKSGVAKVVASFEFEPTERAFREIATKIIKASPDAVFVSTLAPQGSMLTKRLRELGYQGEFVVSLQTARLAELKASNGALAGAWAVSGDDRHAVEYRKLYEERFHESPSELSIYAHDAIKLLLQATDTESVNKYLHTVQNFQGVAGTYSADGNNGFTFEVASKQFTENGFRYVDLPASDSAIAQGGCQTSNSDSLPILNELLTHYSLTMTGPHSCAPYKIPETVHYAPDLMKMGLPVAHYYLASKEIGLDFSHLGGKEVEWYSVSIGMKRLARNFSCMMSATVLIWDGKAVGAWAYPEKGSGGACATAVPGIYPLNHWEASDS